MTDVCRLRRIPNMSTKRISLNMAATYAQTLVSLVIGLFCSRWVYNALGEDRKSVV